MPGRIVSVNVGRPGAIPWRGRQVRTSIFKDPVEGPVALGSENLDGDEQSDLRVHGGPDKAVCCFAREHIPRLEGIVGSELPPGAFGENLSLEGLPDDQVHIGDVFAAGTARVQVSQPRSPCFKLAARWASRTLQAVLAREGISGWYFRVLETGRVQTGDELVLEDRSGIVTVHDVMAVTFGDERENTQLLRRVLAAPALSEEWRLPLARAVA